MKNRINSTLKLLALSFIFLIFSPNISYASGIEISFLSQQWMLTLLLVLGMTFLVIQFFRSKFDIFGVLGFLSFILFFIANFNAGYANLLEITMFLIGAFLLVIEIFVPGFGLIGISGIIFITIGLVTASSDIHTGICTVLLAFLFAFITGIVMFKLGYKSQIFTRIILDKSLSVDEGFKASSKDLKNLEGKEGIVLTTMRPTGEIEIEGKKYDAITDGEFIKKNEKIYIEEITGTRILVRRK